MSEQESRLILNYLNGKQTPGEREEFELWLSESPENREVVESYRKIWSGSAPSVQQDYDREAAWGQFATATQIELTGKSRTLWPVIRIAAAIIGVIVASALTYQAFFKPVQRELHASGAPMHAALPDNSVVWLNENASIIYKSNFSRERSLDLNGEAFFDVTKDTLHPFVINAGKGIIQVLGTSFYVIASAEDSVFVQVISGKVSLSVSQTAIQIDSGQSGSINLNNGTAHLIGLTDPNDIAWKTKQLVFSKDKLENVVRRLGSYFKEDIRISNSRLAGCRFTGTFDDPRLTDIFETLRFALDIKVVREKDGHFLITGQGCNSE